VCRVRTKVLQLLLDTKKTRRLCRADTRAVEDWAVMLAQKLPSSTSELPTRPFNQLPAPRFEEVAPSRTHLMLVKTPKPTPRSLAWARRKGTDAFDSVRFTVMLQLERLNLG
jgi:hypothetical protein